MFDGGTMKRISWIFLISLLGWLCPNIIHSETDSFIYDSKGRRDPFSIVVALKIEEFDKDPSAKLLELSQIEIQGILWDSASPLVMVKDEILSVGEEINQAKILEIDPNQVILEYKGEKITLTVIEEEEIQEIPSLLSNP